MATRSPSAQGILSHLNPATWRPDIWTTPMAPLEEKKISNRSKTHYLAAISVRGSVIPTIFIPTMVLTGWSVLITCLYTLLGIKSLAIGTSLLTIISLVLSLLLVFRTNTAYDRFWSGRQQWTNISTHCRNIARLLWLSVPVKENSDHIQQVGSLKLLLAFAVATKHYLRGEYDYVDYPDLYPLLIHVPEFDPNSPLRQPRELSLNLPYEVAFHLTSYFYELKKNGLADAPTFTAINTSMTVLIDSIGQLERILRSPIPLAYSIHMQQVLFIYLLMLPFQLLSVMGWNSITIQFVASFTMLGIEAIGNEIENPFGFDANDLPLDRYCDHLRSELGLIIRKPHAMSREWNNDFINNPLVVLPQSGNALGLNQDRPAEETKIHRGIHGSIRSSSESSTNVKLRSPPTGRASRDNIV